MRDHTIEVLTTYIQILERCARGNPPDTDPPANLKTTDTVTTLNLVYAFPDPKS